MDPSQETIILGGVPGGIETGDRTLQHRRIGAPKNKRKSTIKSSWKKVEATHEETVKMLKTGSE